MPGTGLAIGAVVVGLTGLAIDRRGGGRDHAAVMSALALGTVVLLLDDQLPERAWVGAALLLVAAVLPTPFAAANGLLAAVLAVPLPGDVPWWGWLLACPLVVQWAGAGLLTSRREHTAVALAALAICAGAVFAAVPDTEVIFLVGIVVTALSFARRSSRLSVAVAAGAVAVAGIDGIVRRPATVVALFAMLGLAPLASRMARASTTWLGVGAVLHTGVVLFAARYAGLSSSLPTTAGRTVVALLLTGLVGAGLLVGSSERHRS